MDLLYMPLLDLQQHLKQELLNNPFLDMVEPEEDEERVGEETRRGDGGNARPSPRKRRPSNDEIDWEEILLDGFDAGGRREEHEEREYYEPVTVDTRDLVRPSDRPDHAARPHARASSSSPTSSSATSTRTAISPVPLDADPRERQRRSRAAPPRRLDRDIDDLPLYTDARSRGDARDHPEPRPAGRRRARPARVPHAPAPRGGARAVGAVSASCATASRS